ncbi:hypothetical protein L6452_00815 [Arctium lappa]|uniref:Uncharacterized protein n=1 Tax=Arctium lappa TaxID=4217 RepID=A0ACB9FEE2_ARCLA|nr:hypothetical protein L6452_00815 [Arctium lappa]
MTVTKKTVLTGVDFRRIFHSLSTLCNHLLSLLCLNEEETRTHIHTHTHSLSLSIRIDYSHCYFLSLQTPSYSLTLQKDNETLSFTLLTRHHVKL